MPRSIVYLQVILIFAVASAIAAQRSPEIGAIGLKDWTKDPDLQNPYGIGFYLFQPVSAKVKLTFEYDYLTSKTRDWIYDYSGSYSARELVQLLNKNRVQIIEIGFRHLVSHSRSEFLEFGGGLCFANICAKRREVHSGDLWQSSEVLRSGLFIDIGLLVADLKSLPLTMRFGFRHRFIGGLDEARIPESAPTFDDAITTTEVSWGFGYQFGR